MTREDLGGASGRIVDGHCHVASTDFIPLSFIEASLDNVLAALAAQGARPKRERLRDLYLAKLQDPDCRELLAEMEQAGIARAVLLLPDFTWALKDSRLTIAEMFERHGEILARHPQSFDVLAGVDPRWGRDGVDLFERGVTELGFRGLKLYPPCGYGPGDRELYPFYEICARHRLPVLIHMGGTSPVLSFDTSRPILVDQPAREFPGVNFILAHGSTAYVEECVMMCTFRPNVFLDVSAFQAQPVEHLKPLFSQGINHKVIFGTDWPLFRMQGSQKSFIDALLAEHGPLGGLQTRELEQFFQGTMQSLIHPGG